MKKRTSILLFWLVIAVFVVAMFIPMGCGSSSDDGGGGDTGSVSGTVTDQNGLPVQSATCSIDTTVYGKEIYSSTTDELGQFTIANVPVGTWTLSISKSGYQTKNITVTVNSGSTTEVPSDETVITPGTSPTPTPTPSPTGTVTPTPSPTGTTTPSPSPTSSPGPGPGPVPVPGISGWEWQNPRPQGDYQIKGYYSTNNISIMVGQDGMIWRDAQGSWTRIDSGVVTDLNSVWGSSDGTRWFIVGDVDAGTGVILYSNDSGVNFTRQASGLAVNLNDVYGASVATDVFIVGDAVGAKGTILYSANGTGSDWFNQSATPVDNANLNGVWVSADGNKVFAVGNTDGQSSILYSADSGTGWARQAPPNDLIAPGVPAPIDANFTDVCGNVDGTKVFIVGAPSLVDAGQGGTIIYSVNDGGLWTNQSKNIGGAGNATIDTTYNSVSILPDGTNAIACGDLVGGNGTLIHCAAGDGANWANRTGTDTGQQPLQATFCNATVPLYSCTGGLAGAGGNANGVIIASADGITWTQNIAQPNHLWTQLNDISAADANNVFAVGGVVGGRPLILSTVNGGTLWTQYAVGGVPGGTTLHAVWARAAGDVYAVGDGGSSRQYDGVNWADNGSGAGAGNIGAINWYGVHGYDANSIYAVGAAGNINRNNGAVWEGQVVPTGGGANQLNDVSCAGTSDCVYAVGEGADLWKYTGGAWAAGSWVDTSTGVTATDALKEVWAADANNVFVVGDDAATHGVLYVTDDGGANWQRTVQAGANTQFESVWGSSSTRVFMVGNQGSIFFYNGLTLQQISPGATPFATITTKALSGVTGSSATDIFICGALDTIIHSITD